MISRQKFDDIKRKYEDAGSWAVWAEAGEKPKSNIGDITVLDPDLNPSLLGILKPDVVMVGLNLSRNQISSFRNFHDDYPRAMDYKIRYAFQGTPFYGAYMTDLIKHHVELDSSNVMAEVKRHPEMLVENIRLFREEMKDIGEDKPILIALGNDVARLLEKNLNPSEYSRIIPLTHYSSWITKEAYRKEVLEKCF